MVNVLALSVLDCNFRPRSDQIKY